MGDKQPWHLFAFFLVLACAITLVSRMARDAPHQEVGGRSVYRYPKAIESVVLTCTIGLIAAPFWGPWLAPIGSGYGVSDSYAVVAIGFCIAMPCFLWCRYFRVIIDDSGVSSGWLLVRRLLFSEISKVQVLGSGTQRKVVLRGSTKKMTIWGALIDFQSLVDELADHLPHAAITVEP